MGEPRAARYVASQIAEAVAAWLESLSVKQRDKATFAFEDEEQRTDWAYYPREHAGLPLLEMDVQQQKLAHALIACSLSLPAYAKATAIMALESVLNEIEGRRADAVRDPGRYFVSAFGQPGDEHWGWRLEGHHVCLNFTFVDGDIASKTPLFFGANPAEVQRGGRTITRPCAEEEDAARELLEALDAGQRKAAVICETAPPDFVLMNLPVVPDTCLPGEATRLPFIQERFEELSMDEREALRFERGRPRGLAASAMNAPQGELLSELIDIYLGRFPDPLAELERERLGAGGMDEIHFAWAGDRKRGGPHYYRLQGPSLLVEYDNTQNEANHVHTVWRHPANDFGFDVLRRHLQREH